MANRALASHSGITRLARRWVASHHFPRAAVQVIWGRLLTIANTFKLGAVWTLSLLMLRVPKSLCPLCFRHVFSLPTPNRK